MKGFEEAAEFFHEVMEKRNPLFRTKSKLNGQVGLITDRTVNGVTNGEENMC